MTKEESNAEQKKLSKLASEAMNHVEKIDKCIVHFEQFMAGPQNFMFIGTYTNLIELYFLAKRYNDALDLLERVRSTLPEDLEIFYVQNYHTYKAAIYVECNEPQMASYELVLACAAFPEVPDGGGVERPFPFMLIWGLILTRHQQMEIRLALSLVEFCLINYGTEGDLELAVAAETYAFNGRAQEGLNLISKNLYKLDSDGFVFISQGVIYEKIGRRDLALASFQNAKVLRNSKTKGCDTKDIDAHIKRIVSSKAS